MNLAENARTGGPGELKALCGRLGIPFHDRLPQVQLPQELIKSLDVAWARKNRLVPIQAAEDKVVVAVSNPLALEPTDELAFTLRKRIEVVVAPEEEILKSLNMIFSESMDTADDLLNEIVAEDEDFLGADLENIPDLIDSDDAAPVIKLVNRILFQAVSEQASDVHIEPGPGVVNVRARIDGILYDRLAPPRHYLPFLSSRIKVMAGLDIAEKRLPQDGRFNFTVAERNIDVRVSVIPTSEGERLVLRLLDKGSAHLSLEDLGLDRENLERFVRLITRPHGIILSTGPTGSGKTTTLYAALSRLNTKELNIITIEDPVEYNLPGVGQIQVNTKIGLDFARGLRSVLRHDPDVIMIGEIRDAETAEIAIQSALTGHQVFSTLHTNDASSAVTRLVDMGIEPYLVSSTVTGVLAQRLVRILCLQCREPYQPSPETLARAGLHGTSWDETPVFRARGCPDCLQTGYRGRTGIYEFLVLDDAIQGTLVHSPEANVIRKVALKAGMKTLLSDGLDKVRRGTTSLEEVLRVTSA
ncbi:MAG: type II secretion system ATPase GspE [Deltaproteobacteria bacterium]|nr:type II secretion system ATPase GspE [Deltaproteobacteria bacterium]MBW2086944.1 type II secretion system ATPase GspE [Deltaproteobacteria bacterium]